MVKSKKLEKRTFFDVETSATASKIALYAVSPEELDGKVIKMDLTRNLRGKGFEMRARVRHISGKLVGEPFSLQLVGSYVRRMMRKGSDYVEDSFITDCKDGKVVIKPFLITRHKVSREVRKALRNLTKEILVAYALSRKFKEIFNEVTTNKIQKDLSIKLKKIYPLALCEIRILEFLENPSKEDNIEKK